MQVEGPDSRPMHEILVEGEDANSIGVRNLNPFTSYTFKVSAKTKEGSGPAACVSSKGGEPVFLAGLQFAGLPKN